jgi:hypothetical protein
MPGTGCGSGHFRHNDSYCLLRVGFFFFTKSKKTKDNEHENTFIATTACKIEHDIYNINNEMYFKNAILYSSVYR